MFKFIIIFNSLLTHYYYWFIITSVVWVLITITERVICVLNNQYKKGVLELCILSLLLEGDRYGYEISEILSERIDIADGTVYPILRKLKSDGLVTTYLSEISGGPPRKYYRLTAFGAGEYEKAKVEWLSFAKTVHEIINKEDPNEKRQLPT